MQANPVHPWRAPGVPRIEATIRRLEMALITVQSPLRTDRLLCLRERLLAKRALAKRRGARA